MTPELIKQWARESGAVYDHGPRGDCQPQLQMGERDILKFAALVAAHENEQCALVCDDMVLYTGFDCAAAIRGQVTSEPAR